MSRRDRPPEWPVTANEPSQEAPPNRTRENVVVSPGERGGRRRLSGHVIALIAAVVLIGALLAYVASTRNPDQDKLSGNQIGSTNASDPEKRCAAQATYDLIKRELFRRAAQVRGSDQASYDRLSAYAVLRMENPVMESQDKDTGAINCSGSLSIDLPPGVAVVGGRRNLMSDVDYTIQKAADGSGDVVLLRNADAIITPLATLSRTAQAQQPAAPEDTSGQVPETGPAQTEAPAPVAPPPPVAPAPQATATQPAAARPSFNCANARTSGERAVCSDAGLAALDRNMSAQYSRAAAQADPEQRRLLEQTRNRFLRYRDHCPTRACIGDTYTGRMREIRDIMAGTWQAPR